MSQSEPTDPPNQPVSKHDLAELETRLYDRLTEFMRRIETSFLKEFHYYAKGQATRGQAVELRTGAIELRIHEIEARLLELESRIRPRQ